jgi:hypothetical protein
MHVELVVAKRENLEAQLRAYSHEVFEANTQHRFGFFNIDPLYDGILDLAYAICVAMHFKLAIILIQLHLRISIVVQSILFVGGYLYCHRRVPFKGVKVNYPVHVSE